MPYFDRFDICEAYWLLAAMYHNGKGSALYQVFARLRRIDFNPRPNLDYDRLSANGKAIYDAAILKRRPVRCLTRR